MAAEKSDDDRWDMHSDRQVAASKGAALAVTLLNSGSWLALLSQVSNLEGHNIAVPVLLWGTGALLGTSLWLFIYRGSLLLSENDFNREDVEKYTAVDKNIRLGVLVAVASLCCFGVGVLMLALALLS